MKKILALLLSLTLMAFPTFAQETPSEEAAGLQSDLVILYTSDVHCGIDKNLGYEGVYAIKNYYESLGDHVLLVDDGDFIQGESIGTLTEGEAIITLMNKVGYDIVIPGNHEFDFGMDTFFHLVDMSDFEFISCNFNKEGELVFPAYTIKEFDGVKVGFVGVCTPTTISTSTPKSFQDENGKFIYGFLKDSTGDELVNALQSSVDAARQEGADYVICMSHLGNKAESKPWTYADMIEKTNGIDFLIDGHSHDTDQVTVLNKDGVEVQRSAVGTKLSCVGCLTISTDGTLSNDVISWNNSISAPELLGIHNDISEVIDESKAQFEDLLSEEVATSVVTLTIYDPVEKNSAGNPIRIVRNAETNLGDLCADALRYGGNAEIGLINGGGIRNDLPQGSISFNDLITTFPFGNYVTTVIATGQQILDALEWSVSLAPEEFGGFLQVSGLTYEVHTYVDSSCTSNDNGFTGVEGEYRVKNVLVNGEPLDLEKTYSVAGLNYFLKNDGNGYTMFKDCESVMKEGLIDVQCLRDYITDSLGGNIDETYENPYGQNRIVFVEEAPTA